MDLIKSEKRNFIRLGVTWAGAQPKDADELDPAFVERLHAILDLTDRTGIHVMLDNHGDVRRPFTSSCFPAESTNSTQSNSHTLTNHQQKMADDGQCWLRERRPYVGFTKGGSRTDRQAALDWLSIQFSLLIEDRQAWRL